MCPVATIPPRLAEDATARLELARCLIACADDSDDSDLIATLYAVADLLDEEVSAALRPIEEETNDTETPTTDPLAGIDSAPLDDVMARLIARIRRAGIDFRFEFRRARD